MPVPPTRPTAALVTAGAVAVAATTSLELVTSPYSPAVVAYPLNGAVHAAKVVAVLALVVGLGAFCAGLRRRGERVAAGAAGVVAGALLVGAAPYSVVEALLDPRLTPAAAEAELDATYVAQPWITAGSMVALPLLIVGLVVLGVAVLRSRTLPGWAPAVSLASIPVAVLAGVLNGLGWAVPHPPAWVVGGLAAYGVALLRGSAPAARAAELTSRRS